MMTVRFGRFRLRILALVLPLIAMMMLTAPRDLLPMGDLQPFDPRTGYRIGQLRDPVPDLLPGAEVLNIDKLEALLSTGRPLLVDVYDDRPGRLQRWSLGLLQTPEDRMHIAGSIAMAGFGDGALSHAEARVFQRQLDEAAGGDSSRPIVFYCLANCWTSWNAARRAIALGYANVKWYRDGVEAWSDAGLPMAPVIRDNKHAPNVDLAMSAPRR